MSFTECTRFNLMLSLQICKIIKSRMSRSQLRNHVPSAFNLNVMFCVLVLVPRYRGTTWNFTLSPSSLSPQITQPIRRGTKKSRFLNPGPYASPLDRSRSFPIERIDTIHVADHARATMSITVRDFSSRSYCSSLLPLRDFFALEQGRTFADRG